MLFVPSSGYRAASQCGISIISIETSQHAPGPRHASLDRNEQLAAVMAAGPHLIDNDENRDSGYEQ
jgi:hypothetical protein